MRIDKTSLTWESLQEWALASIQKKSKELSNPNLDHSEKSDWMRRGHICALEELLKLESNRE